jgi:hypothetical protein
MLGDSIRQAGWHRERQVVPGVRDDTGEVARAGYQGLMRGNTTVVPGLYNQILASIRFTP